MDFIEEFRDDRYAKVLVEEIRQISNQPLRFMEFCGGHTATMLKYGIKGLLPPNIEILAGPGCPVCVTSCSEIDYAVKLSQESEIILTSFGDMFKVRGSRMSLSEQKALGADIRTIYSPDDAVKIAIDNPSRTVIFFAIGFETTAPATAAALKLAKRNNIQNFYIYSVHKTTPGILKVLVSGKIKIDGFLCPGHVTTITGTSIYDTLINAGKPCVVSGFEPLDILQSIYLLIKQVDQRRAEVEIQYKRVTTSIGNRIAQALMDEVFEPTDAYWRGIGIVSGTGLKLRETFRQFDAAEEFAIDKTSLEKEEETPGCLCGSILRGLKTPLECPLFRKICMPENPVGACMVSEEGTCSIYFRFGQKVNE